jgi:hypothetical protein
VSRTERETTSSWVRPDITSPKSGAAETLPREGLRPTSPHALAGMRIEPPPSFAWAIGTIPAATATAEPALEPPGSTTGMPRSSISVGEYGFFTCPPSEL